MVKRKGAGYSIELIASIFILLAFAAGSFNIPEAYNWSSYQRKIAGQDLSYTLKRTGHLTHFMENAETGSLKTAVTTLSGRDMHVSGAITHLPMISTSVGYNVLPAKQFRGQELQSSLPKCSGDLSELKSEIQPGTELKRTDPTHSRESYHEVTLYVGDTDPRISGGFNSQLDYDTLWVDNGTTCQFSSSEGPYYLDEFFLWGNTTDSNPENYYDIKSIESDQLNLFQADQPVAMRNMLNQDVNSVETGTSVDTFDLDNVDLSNYDVIVFRKNESISRIQSHRGKIEDFMREGSLLLLANLNKTSTKEPFIEDMGLEWINMSHASVNPGNIDIAFDQTTAYRVETYFEGLDGVKSSVSLAPGGWVKTRGISRITSSENFVIASSQHYDSDDWNSSSWSMTSTAAPPGAPSGSQYTIDTFTFPDGSTYDVLNTCLGSCSNGIRGLNIDLNDNGNFGDEGEGPFLQNQDLVVADRKYYVNFPDGPGCDNGHYCAEFVFNGSDTVDIVNHMTDFEGVDSERLARAAYEQNYEEEDIKLLASTIYWLRGDQIEFKQQYQPRFSTQVVGLIKNDQVMPYKLSLRWSDE